MDSLRLRAFFVFGALALAGSAAAASTASAQPPGQQRFEVRDRAARGVDPKDGKPVYVLTLDACGGEFDWELGGYLERRRIPATIFVTKLFIDGNPKAVAFLRAHQDLFDIQNHGARHHAAIEERGELWKVPMVGDDDGLRQEVQGGERAIEQAFGKKATLFRGATAVYDERGKRGVEAMGFEVAGYEVSLDAGGVLAAPQVMARALGAAPGAVLIGHINRPKSRNGAHIAAALEALGARGSKFESWSQARAAGAVSQWRSGRPGPG